MSDLIILVADRNAEYAVHGAMSRPEALGVRRNIDYKVISHPGHDGGVRKTGVQLVGVERRSFDHALVLLDFEGSGASQTADELEASLDQQLAAGWGDAAKAIVIDPEVDVWLWGAETHLREVLDWRHDDQIRTWLQHQGFGFNASGKPERPKEAFEAICRRSGTPRSSTLYRDLAQRLSLARCEDGAFQRLRTTMGHWFPAN